MAAPRRPSPDRLLKAAMAVAARQRWRSVSMNDIAAEAKVGLDQLHAVFPSKAAIVAALNDRVDAAMLGGTEDEAAGEPARERLFDVLMRRFDSIAADKQAIASILRDAGGDPCAALCAAPRLMRSMAWSLEAAGISSAGLPGLIRTKALAAIYLSTMLVWLRDDSPDHGRTMAHLDRKLRRAERLAQGCFADRRRAPDEAPEEEAA